MWMEELYPNFGFKMDLQGEDKINNAFIIWDNMKIKRNNNEKDPQDYYQESSALNKSGKIWYIVKVVAIIILTILFFNKKLLSKVNLSLQKKNS